MKIKELLLKIWNAIHKVFDKTDEQLKKFIPIAVNVVEAIKTFNESPAADLIEYIIETAIPGPADDVIIKQARNIARTKLPFVLIELKIIKSITDLTDDNEKLKAILAELKVTSTKGIIFKGVAGKFLELCADGNFSFNDSVDLTTYYFKQLELSKAA